MMHKVEYSIKLIFISGGVEQSDNETYHTVYTDLDISEIEQVLEEKTPGKVTILRIDRLDAELLSKHYDTETRNNELNDLWNTMNIAPELNMNNYSVDDVEKLNSIMIEAFALVDEMVDNITDKRR